jgi:hypothetical protein
MAAQPNLVVSRNKIRSFQGKNTGSAMACFYKKSKQNEVVLLFVRNNGIRRLGLARREFSYDEHIPERRCDEDRRSGLDRRLKPRTAE